MADPDVLIVGAGLTGLTAARALRDAGRTVRVIDKGVAPGGRLATRRIDAATLDHGAQFFTVRSDAFAALTTEWRDAGVPVERWSSGFVQATDVRDGLDGITSSAGDGHPRYTVPGGMNALAKALARGLEGPPHGRRPAPDPPGSERPAAVMVTTRAIAAWVRDGRWHVATTGADGHRTHRAAALVCTPPVPQTLAVLDRGGTTLPTHVAAALRAVTYDPCLALLVVLDADPALPEPGGVQFASGPVRWLADNARKDVSARPAITLHASADWSSAWYDAPDDDVAATLHAWLEPWIGGAAVTAWQVKRWRYSQPRDTLAQPVMSTEVGGAAVVFGGDAFGHPRVEGAARSGLAAAAVLSAGR